MSVFTPVARDELEQFLAGFELGELIDFNGIAGGSENSNFFVSTGCGRFVLTLIERDPVARELPFFIELLDLLHAAGLPVPHALRDRAGRAVQRLNGKPALLQPRFEGSHPDRPTAAQCRAVGGMLARLHLATSGSGLARGDDRGPAWVLAEGRRVRPSLGAEQAGLLAPVLACLDVWQARSPALPEAVLHADLFRDNVLFEGERLAGVIDFYNAASGWCLYDVAITCNDWCVEDSEADGLSLDPGKLDALLSGYAAIRPFTPAEHQCWTDMLRLAATRFWLSRRIAAAEHGGQSGVLIKDPEHFVRVLGIHGLSRALPG
jgi:homoserine kinase type II